MIFTAERIRSLFLLLQLFLYFVEEEENLLDVLLGVLDNSFDVINPSEHTDDAV